MKTIILLLFLSVSFFSYSQADTSHVDITLKSKHHAWVISLMPNKGEVESIKYINQVASQLSLPIDTAQQITVSVQVNLVKNLYLVIGSQQERLATTYNNEIKDALLPQLMTYPDLLAGIMIIAERNATETNVLVNYGFDYLKAIK